MEFFSEAVRRDPYPLYDQLRAGSPVRQVPGTDMWAILDYEGVKRALDDHETFSSRVTIFDWMIFHDPPRHAKLRALVLRAFTPRMVANLEPRIREISRELLDRTMGHPGAVSGELDLAADFGAPLPMMVIAEMLGIPLEDRLKFKEWSDAILNLAETVSNTGEAANRAAVEYGAVTSEMSVYLAALVKARKKSPQDDLITRLAAAELDGERLTHEELLGFFQLLLLAGSETTANLVSNTVLCFMEHADQLARVRERIELLPAAIEEVLRFRSPVQAVFRETMREVKAGGQTIPAGKRVLVMIGSANRDPRTFERAGRFEVGRDPNPHLAFGHSLHFCLGAALARLEAKISLTEWLRRTREFQLASDEPWEPRKAFHVHGPTRLPIRFERREPIEC